MKQQSAGSWHYRTVGHDDLLLAVFRPAYRPGTQPAGRSYFFDKANGSPLSSAAATGFTLSGLAMRQPGGGSSRTMPRRRSPAVVIAATPPVISAIARAKALPPRWPPSKGTATEPSSATATTDGSLSLAARAVPPSGSGCRWRICRQPGVQLRIARRCAPTRGRISRPNPRDMSAVRAVGRPRTQRAIAVRWQCRPDRAQRSQCRRVVTGLFSEYFR